MSIREALRLKNYDCEVGGEKITLRRPSAMDMIEAVEFSKKDPNKFGAWLVYNHLIEDGTKMFQSVDDVLKCDGGVIAAIALEIDKLYGEGRD